MRLERAEVYDIVRTMANDILLMNETENKANSFFC